MHSPKSNLNFRDIAQNIEENEILHEIFRVVSPFPRYISCYISENRLPLGQCAVGWVNLYQKFEIEKYTVCGKLILSKKNGKAFFF